MNAVQQEIEGPVAWVWLNRPDRLNAIDETVLSGLLSAFVTLGKSDSVRAIVLAARGSAFSAGFDLKMMAGQGIEAVETGMDAVYAVYEAVESCTKPVIAAIPGVAAGGGLLLALAADVRLSSDAASFLAPEVRIGLFPALGLVRQLERTVGVGAAKRLLLTGDAVGAMEALRIGLVDTVIPAGELVARSRMLAEGIAALPPYAVQQTKAAFARLDRPDYREWEKTQFAACWRLPERAERMQAFLQRAGRSKGPVA